MSGSTGCHHRKTTTNHGGKHEFDIDTNDYNDTTITGCTNSGAGCHGADPTGMTGTGDIVDYHPAGAASCLAGGCHTSADKATATQPHTCSSCHDGTFDNALDTVALTDAAPAGHYGETTHTAASMTTSCHCGRHLLGHLRDLPPGHALRAAPGCLERRYHLLRVPQRQPLP